MRSWNLEEWEWDAEIRTVLLLFAPPSASCSFASSAATSFGFTGGISPRKPDRVKVRHLGTNGEDTVASWKKFTGFWESAEERRGFQSALVGAIGDMETVSMGGGGGEEEEMEDCDDGTGVAVGMVVRDLSNSRRVWRAYGTLR